MLNENQINFLPERIQERLNKINAEYFESVGKTLKKIGELRPSDVHKLQQLYDYGAEADKIAKKLAAASSKNIDEIYQIYDIVAKDNYDFAKPFYKAKGIPHPVYKDNKKLKDFVRSIAKQTVDEYVNLTQHTAFAIFDKTGKSIAPLFETNKNKLATSLSDTYTKIVDYAVTKVQLGEESYQNAVQEVCKAMVNSGIKAVDYATGYSRRLDSAVRQNVLWGVKQCNQNTAEMIGEEFGADGYEVSYHSNPRESHADMAGKQFAKGKARTIDGVFYPSFEEVAKPLLEEYGCLHFYYPILLGISSPAYSKEQLEELKANDNKTFEFEGKKYTGYEAEQTQRKLETAIRHNRDLIISAKAAGSKALENEARENIDILARKYKKFSDAAGLPTQMERTQLAVKKVDKSVESGIIKLQGGKIMSINNIDSPIEQRNTGKGNPNAILMFDRPLNSRQQKLLDKLDKYDSRIVVPKKAVNMKDLSALTAVTGNEFALFTKGKERLVIRGNASSVNIDIKQAYELSNQGYKWSGHTHPGMTMNCLQASSGDKAVLACFKQKVAYIYNSKGDYLEFWKE